MLMLVLSYRRRNGVPENKCAQLCRGRGEFYRTLAAVFFHFTLYFVFCNLLAVGASGTFTWSSALPTTASQCWAGPLWRLATWVWRDIHPLWTMWTKKHIQILLPSCFLLPSPAGLLLQDIVVMCACWESDPAAIHRATTTCSVYLLLAVTQNRFFFLSSA